MHIFIKTLTGKLLTFNVLPDNTINDIKHMINCEEGIIVDQQRLIFVGKHLMDSKTLNDYNIRDGNTLNLVLMLRGG